MSTKQVKISRLAALALTALAFMAPALPAVAAGYTATTWDEALALSEQHGKPILIDFFTEW